jgi:hypothetical protein
MLSVQVRSGEQVVRTLSLAQFLGAQVMPTAMFVEEAIVRFNLARVCAGEPERAALVKIPTLH